MQALLHFTRPERVWIQAGAQPPAPFTQLYIADVRRKPPGLTFRRDGDFPLTEASMTTLKTMMMALLAGSLAATAGGVAYARTDGKAFDPAQFQQRIEKRVDKALNGTDATAEQKKKVADILGQTFKDMRPMHEQRVANRKAMAEALQAPTIDAARIEGIRAEQMKISDASSKRFTQALTDAGNVLSQAQRQAFFKNWSANHERHGRRG
jgi:Spy/CpxP family protein refolding chaperone